MRVPRMPRAARHVLTIVVALAIGYASVIKPPDTPAGWTLLGIVSDYWLHAVAYAILSGTIVFANFPEHDSAPKQVLAAAYFASVGYGLMIEFLQTLLSYRMFSLVDLGANAAGALFGIAMFRAIDRRYFAQRPS